MIRKLRRRHFRVMIVLACVLPLVFMLGLVRRQVIPVMNRFPPGLGPSPPQRSIFWQKDVLVGEVEATLATRSDGAEWTIDIRPAGELAHPDLLVYAGNGPGEQTLDQEYLIGAMAGAEWRRFQIPEVLVGQGFALKFYSMAHREMVAELVVPAEATEAIGSDL